MIPLDRILDEKPRFLGSFYGGSWHLPKRPSGTIELYSPANIEWELPSIQYSFDHVDESVAEARKAYLPWRSLKLEQRIAHLKNFGAELMKRAELIAKYVAIETGKPYDEALGEVKLLENKIHVTIEHGLSLVKTELLDLGPQGRGEIHWLPKGVLVVIGPFNFPVHLSHGHIVPALLMGNVCVLKPSEKTPLSAQAYIEAAAAAGLPSGVLQLVEGNGEMGLRLVKNVGTDGVLGTCSYDVGSRIQKELAEKPEKIVALEMGGKNGALVWDGIDNEKCAQDLIKSAFLTTGQRCTAVSRVYVKKSLMEPLIARVHALAKELVISHPFEVDPKPFMGPLISTAAKDRFLRYAGAAEIEKARVIMRPKPLSGETRMSRKPLPDGHYVSPSLHCVETWNPKSAYQTHELFGPDMFFCPVESFEEGVAAINSSSYGLVSSLFGGTEDLFSKFAESIECGLVYYNRATVGASARLPFGGWKRSGNQRPAGIFAAYTSSQPQARILF